MSAVSWRRRADGLTVEELEGSVVVFDARTDDVLCLTGPAVDVFRACAAGGSVEEIASAAGLALDVTAAHLGELADRGLVVSGSADDSRMARRTLLPLAGAVAAAAVWSVAAPTPAAALSGQEETTTTPY